MDLTKLASLPIAERLQALEVLWESLDGEDADLLPAPAWHAEVLAERIRALDEGKEELLDLDEAMAEVRRELKRG